MSKLITKEKLEELYIEKEWLVKDIADFFGVTRAKINYEFKKNGITKKPKVKHVIEKDWLYEQYVAQSKSPQTIAKELGIDPRTIYNNIDKYGIERIDYSRSISPGDVFNKLTTIEIIGERKNGTKIWLCQCECGKKTRVDTAHLKYGSTKSCSCIRKGIPRTDLIGLTTYQNYNWKGCGEISGHIWSSIRATAKNRKHDFEINIEYVWDLFLKQNRKCALTNEEICFVVSGNNKNGTTASLDRIDNSKGYIEGNVWWTHSIVNRMKWTIPLNELFYLCDRVSKYNTINYNDIKLSKKEKYCINNIFSATQYNANRRKINWDLSKDDLYQLYEKQGGTCYLSGIPLYLGRKAEDYSRTASIDRLDNNRGYSVDNVAWVYKTINMSRGELSVENYKYWCQLISEGLYE